MNNPVEMARFTARVALEALAAVRGGFVQNREGMTEITTVTTRAVTKTVNERCTDSELPESAVSRIVEFEASGMYTVVSR